MILRRVYFGLLVLFAVQGVGCSSDSGKGSSQEESENNISGGGIITPESVAALWQQYEDSTGTTCIEALKIAIGESGLTGVPESSGQIPCTGNCIDANAVSPYGATGIWQVKCPESTSVLIYNAFESNGLIDGTGQCVDLKVPANNALAASLYITVSCPYFDQSGFCSQAWTGDQNHPEIAGGYYNQFTAAATAACASLK